MSEFKEGVRVYVARFTTKDGTLHLYSEGTIVYSPEDTPFCAVVFDFDNGERVVYKDNLVRMNPESEGVWVVDDTDSLEYPAIFKTELEALRYANNLGYHETVRFQPFTNPKETE